MTVRVVVMFIIGIALGILAAGAFFLWYRKSPPTPAAPSAPATVTPREEPPRAGEPLSARVRVESPKEGTTVGVTFKVLGEAPGNWYFEASFPIQVRDGEGNVIGRGIAQSKSDWMTTAQVPFAASITIKEGYHGPATLILLKDNPSGLPEHDDSVSFDIVIR